MSSTNSKLINKHQRWAIGTFPNSRDAELAFRALRESSFPTDRVSVLACQANYSPDQMPTEVSAVTQSDHLFAQVGTDERATVGAASGGALDGSTGLLVGLDTLSTPTGSMMLAGTTATAPATTLSNSAIDESAASGIIGALVGLGVPEDRANVYRDCVARGEYLVIVNGTAAELAGAEAILQQCGIQEYGIYDAPGAAAMPQPTNASTEPSTAAALSPTVGTAPSEADLCHSNHAIGFFSHLEAVEHAVVALKSTGFPLNQVSLIAHQFARPQNLVGVNLCDRFEAMPLGIPTTHADIYNDQIAQGNYVVVVNGNEDELQRATTILQRRDIQEWNTYNAPAVNVSQRHGVSNDRSNITSPLPLAMMRLWT